MPDECPIARAKFPDRRSEAVIPMVNGLEDLDTIRAVLRSYRASIGLSRLIPEGTMLTLPISDPTPTESPDSSSYR